MNFILTLYFDLQVIPPRDRGEDEDTLDLGLMGVGGQRDVEFALINSNPVEIALESWGLESHGDQMVKVWVELLGVGAGSRKQVLERWENTSSNLTQTVSNINKLINNSKNKNDRLAILLTCLTFVICSIFIYKVFNPN
jgi:hypothetical protein